MSLLPETSEALTNRNTFRAWLSQQTEPVVVKFYADWCRPCQQIKQFVRGLVVDSQRIILVEVNVDTHRDIASAYRIRGIPAFMSFRDGQPEHTMSGNNISDLNHFFAKVMGNKKD